MKITSVHLEHALFDLVEDVELDEVLTQGVFDASKLRKIVKERL